MAGGQGRRGPADSSRAVEEMRKMTALKERSSKSWINVPEAKVRARQSGRAAVWHQATVRDSRQQGVRSRQDLRKACFRQRRHGRPPAHYGSRTKKATCFRATPTTVQAGKIGAPNAAKRPPPG